MISRNLFNKRAFVFYSSQKKYFFTNSKKVVCFNTYNKLSRIKFFSSLSKAESAAVNDSVTNKDSVSYHDEASYIVSGKKGLNNIIYSIILYEFNYKI